MIFGVILSGGASRRMGTPKALLDVGGETFLSRLIRVFSTECSQTVIVLGHGATVIQESVVGIATVVNPDPERGMFSSLQCGIAQMPAMAEGVVFTPVDYPLVQRDTISQVVAAFHRHRAPVTLPTYGGKNGHPVCISRAVVSELLSLPACAVARDVIRAHRAETVFVEVNDPGILHDIDTPADYRAMAL